MVRQGPAKPLSPVRIWVPPNFITIMLYIIPTPIGNLKDITLRALETLKACDALLCEDTRVASKLLNHFEIKKKLISFYKEKEHSLEPRILEELKAGKILGLISDAGTPAINDPGTSLIHACHKEGIKAVALPGACSVICALSLSGLEFNHFQFLGFFPRKEGEKKKLIESILDYDGVSIFFESPKRLLKTIALFPEDQTLYVAKELTKIHEALIEVTKDTAEQFTEPLSRGEICVLVKGQKKESNLSLDDQKLMESLTKHLSQRDAVKVAAELTGKKKQAFYDL